MKTIGNKYVKTIFLLYKLITIKEKNCLFSWLYLDVVGILERRQFFCYLENFYITYSLACLFFQKGRSVHIALGVLANLQVKKLHWRLSCLSYNIR